MQKSALRHLGREIRVYDQLSDVPAKSFDLVCSFEVIEHFTDPMAHLEQTLSKIADDGCFAESTGFADCSLPGHFEYYAVNGERIKHRQVSKIMADYLRTGYLKVMKGVQCKPRVWGKVMVGYDKKPRVWREGAPQDAVTFHGHCREMDTFGLDHFVVQGIRKQAK